MTGPGQSGAGAQIARFPEGMSPDGSLLWCRAMFEALLS